MTSRPATPSRNPLDDPGLRTVTRASTKDTKEKIPKMASAHTPTDIGDRYLKFRPPFALLISMCQKLSG